jgi:hypothetical protein
MGVEVTVVHNIADLTDRLKARIAEVATVIEEESGEMGVRFKDRLIGHAASTYHNGSRTVKAGTLMLDAPGSGLWPVGTRRGESYLWPNDGSAEARSEAARRGMKPSGRSLRAWTVRYRDGVLTAKNAARDRKRNRYAEHVHFAGKPPGSAVEGAAAAFRDEADEAAGRIRKRLLDLLDG